MTDKTVEREAERILDKHFGIRPGRPHAKAAVLEALTRQAQVSDDAVVESSGCVWLDLELPCKTPGCPVCERWEVRPCVDKQGNVNSYDICLASEPEAAGVAVIASIYSGKEVADDIAFAHNTALDGEDHNPDDFVHATPEQARIIETAVAKLSATNSEAVSELERGQ
jgi:hypothetical protein